ncbi:hypothetical protein HZU75_00430 [Chitinibacter fontanus]|uniref:Flagellar protein FliT n=1 Tax=Chitinibacter fontanus TaxID=1737446 RepID=A0A7D5Z7T3_9NEIS|nr:hypothetical protein [Chitinibacter fontanus]QLI80125.1 hypothetical protein HZU75_00430 [Chitinibacter fontanus]
MEAFDFESLCLQYSDLLKTLQHVSLLAKQSLWDELHEQLPNVINCMAALPEQVQLLNKEQEQKYSMLVTETINEINALQPVLSDWHEELAKLLQGSANETKLFNAYRA